MTIRSTVVLHLSGRDLDDALSFTRLRGILKKIYHSTQIIIIHDALHQAQKLHRAQSSPSAHETFNPGDALHSLALRDLSKTLSQKLSEELIPAVSLAAYHLGIVKHRPDGEITHINIDTLRKRFISATLPIITPLGDHNLVLDHHRLASKIASSLEADALIFAEDESMLVKEIQRVSPDLATGTALPFSTFVTVKPSLSPSALSLYETAFEALREGTKSVMITTLGGLDDYLLKLKPPRYYLTL